MGVSTTIRSANSQLEGVKLLYHYVHGICRGFDRQRLESQERLGEEGTNRTITQVLNIIQKVPEPVIRLKVDEEQWEATKQGKGQMGT